MNTNIFIERLKAERKKKYGSQAEFADAYLREHGSIRKKKAEGTEDTEEVNMFPTVQKWEQGRSFPTIDVLYNICEMLECDADYLLGNIEEKTNSVHLIREYTGLSEEAIENLNVANDFPIGEVMEINRIVRPSREDDKPSHAIDLILKDKTIMDLLVNYMQLEDSTKDHITTEDHFRASALLLTINIELDRLKRDTLHKKRTEEIKKIDEYDNSMRKARAKKKK